MKTTIELIKELPGVKVIEVVGNVAVCVFEPEETGKKPLFTNSLGEEFFKGDVAYWFVKKDYELNSASMDRLGCDYIGNKSLSEIYKTKETAYRKSVEYAHEQGERIEYAREGCEFMYLEEPVWNWRRCHYRIKQEPDWLGSLWNVDPRIAEAAAKDLGYKNRR